MLCVREDISRLTAAPAVLPPLHSPHKVNKCLRTNRVTTADFAFCSADTKLGRFDQSFFSGVPLPSGVYFAIPAFCETLYPITA
jgi:hypothetical protein